MISGSSHQRSRAILPGVVMVAALVLAGLVATWTNRSAWLDELVSYVPDLLALSKRHLFLVGISAGLAAGVGVPLGILLSRPAFRSIAEGVMQVLNVGSTVPTLAVLALSMSVLGIGIVPGVLALWLATLLPIVRNTYAGLKAVSPALLDAANGMGMTSIQRLHRVELPNALPVVFAGLRTAATVNIATAPLASLIGAGGYGDLIFAGIQLYDPIMMLAGALATALLALAVDGLLAGLQRGLLARKILPHSKWRQACGLNGSRLRP
jgi:osmoprotectant transport system permease protein